MKISSKPLTIDAPSKVNLHLAVKDKKPDGCHNLESVFLAIDFGDTLNFEVSGRSSLVINLEGVKFAIPLEENIIFKAISLFKSVTGFDHGLRMTLEKRVPPGGGLGGGSSDAASTLLALNKISGAKLSEKKLMEMALSLGSDVPFFISQSAAAWVSGRGEYVKKAKIPKYHCVLVNPGFSSETSAAYKLLDECRAGSGELSAAMSEKECLKALSGKPETWPFKNDFLDVLPDSHRAVYQKIIGKLTELGAGFASLSGSGSTCFGVFTSKSKAESAADTLRNTWEFVKIARSI